MGQVTHCLPVPLGKKWRAATKMDACLQCMCVCVCVCVCLCVCVCRCVCADTLSISLLHSLPSSLSSTLSPHLSLLFLRSGLICLVERPCVCASSPLLSSPLLSSPLLSFLISCLLRPS